MKQRSECSVELEPEDFAKLHQISKIETIGEMASGVAHDFNNLLNPIVMTMDEIQRNSDSRSLEQSRRIDRARACAERAQRLVHRMLDFIRSGPPQCELLDVGQVVAGMGDIFRAALRPGMFVEIDVGSRLPRIEADRNELETALLNLIINARDAMPEGGKITVSAAEEAFLPSSINEMNFSRMLRISVSDVGTGMDEVTLRRSTDPFFSTKARGSGTGLGLSMVRALVTRLRGHLSIQSRAGYGTTVDIWLPVATTQN